MTQDSTITAGIDTSKLKLDVAVHGAPQRLSVSNDMAGWQELAGFLRVAGVGRVGIEATGGYERGVVRFLRAAGLEVLRLQPLQVKAFARVRLRRAKNDALDAALIAACASVLEAPSVPADPRLEGLADRLSFVEQTEEDIARAKTRLEHIDDARQRRLVEGDIKRLQRRRADELQRIEVALEKHEDLAQRYRLVLSIPCVGERTALAITLRMPELGQISREQAAALAGLAPFDDDSGLRKGERHIAGGRARLRRSLYMAAFSGALHWNKALMALYQRLTARGKPAKLALVACARKLIIFANAVVQRGTPWVTHRTGEGAALA